MNRLRPVRFPHPRTPLPVGEGYGMPSLREILIKGAQP